jgi:hypothetical protein
MRINDALRASDCPRAETGVRASGRIPRHQDLLLEQQRPVIELQGNRDRGALVGLPEVLIVNREQSEVAVVRNGENAGRVPGRTTMALHLDPRRVCDNVGVGE